MPADPKPKRLKMLYVGTLPPHPGGSAISCSQLLVGFAGLGHEVRAVAAITAEALQAGDRFSTSHPDIKVRRYLLPYFDATPYVPVPDEYRSLEREAIYRIVPRLIEEDRPDIVVIGRESFAWHVPDLARTHDVPSVLLVRGGTTIGILNNTLPETHSRRLLEEFRKVDLVVTPARHLAGAFRQFGFDNVTVIMNAVDLVKFCPRAKSATLSRGLAIREEDVVVTLVANLNARKRPLDVVRSAQRTLREHQRLLYVIVGDGALRGEMEETCRQGRILERFRFVGWIDYDRVPDFLNLADMVILPSEAEGLARVYLETQACGRVLITTDIAAAREVVTDGQTGLLFPVGNVEELASKTLMVAAHPDLRDRIGRKAREAVKAFSLDHAVAEYLAAFEGVVRSHGSGSRWNTSSPSITEGPILR